MGGNMNCFQLIKTVLDELYIKIPGQNDAEKDRLITQKIEYLCDRYKNLLNQHDPIDYSDPVTRFAYIYKYVPFHANIIYTIINRSEELKLLFSEQKLKTTCIGGGPGSDLLGILKYSMEFQLCPNLSFTLFDHEETWGESWEDVGDKLESDIRVNSYFQRFDVTDSRTWIQKNKYLDAKLFTMMYFLSEVYSVRDKASIFFNNFFEKIPDGSLVLFIDNNSKEFIEWFDEMSSQNFVVPIRAKSENVILEDHSEQKTDLGIYYQKFSNIENCRPKLTANLVYRVCKKISI
jgi:hypothetical protein